MYELNDLQGTDDAAQTTVKYGDLTGQADAPASVYPYLALTRLASGDADGATRAMEELDRVAGNPSLSAFGRARWVAARVIFAVRRDDQGELQGWSKRLSEYLGNLRIEDQYVPGRALIAQGKKAEAAEQLRGVYENAIRAGAQGLAIRIRVCQALAAPNEAEALAFLREALEMGEPEGFIRTFVDEGKLLAPLLRQALSRGVTPEYTARLLDVIRDEERQNRAAGKTSPGGQAPGPLSERELQILQLIEAGLSNRQIAERLVITLATAKTHVHNLCGKLNASTRTQALARAREQRLI